MPSHELILLGKRIREIRSRSQLSQERLSELCRISPRHISEIERGESNPSYQVLLQIATSLRVPLSSLLEQDHLREGEKIQGALIAAIQVMPLPKLRMLYRVLVALEELRDS